MSKFCGNIIPLYDSAPNGKIQVEELEELLTIRNNILHEIEAKIQMEREKGDRSTNSTKYPFMANTIIATEGKIGWNGHLENDKTSHFIISVAFCKNEQERVWLANLESKLFMSRLEYYTVDLEEVLRMLNIPLERQEIIPESLLEKIRFRDRGNTSNTLIYRIPFEYALNLIPSMHYFLNRGYVYITKAEIFKLIETVFKENMIKKLALINKNLDKILSDLRIKSLIHNFQTKREVETLSKNFNNVQTENISYKDVDMYADKAFPLCMQLLHKSLTGDGHLKHWGRLQYGLFLKGIGLSLDESLNFWRMKFSKSIASDKFDKEYSYGIRHHYGKEGKRNDYIPYSCNKVQTYLAAPSSGEHHGCPFKVFSEDKMRHLLYEMKFKELDVLKILEKVRNKEFSVACIRYFEAKFPNSQYEKVGIHPNHYFESASKLLKSDSGKNSEGNYNKKYAPKKQIAYEAQSGGQNENNI